MAEVLIDGVSFNHNLASPDLAEAVTAVQNARATKSGLMALLADSIKAGNPQNQWDVSHQILTHPGIKLAAAIHANKKIKIGMRQSLERCLSVSDLLSFSSPLLERVPVFPMAKKSGAVRMIHNPRLLHRTSQAIMLEIMGKYFAPRPYQFTHRGVPAAIAEVKKLLTAGHIHLAHCDITDFFPSFDPDELVSELPLPKEAVEHVVVGRQLKVTMDQETRHGKLPQSLPHTHLLDLARLGIPQGSACSPIIGMYILARLPWHAHDGVSLVNYADDFLLLAVSAQQLDDEIGVLTDAVKGLPGGHFTLRQIASRTANQGIDFLGHHLRVRQGHVVTKPTTSNLEAIAKEQDRLDIQLGKATYPISGIPSESGITLLAEMVASLNGWRSAFRECDDIARYETAYMAAVEQWMQTLDVSMAQVKAAIDPSMTYVPADYAFGH